MRSCIYCGRELAPGEKCTCRQSARKNGAQSNDPKQAEHTQNTYSTYNDPNRTEYRTGYTHKDNSFKRAYEKMKSKTKRSGSHDFRSGFKGFIDQIWSALRSPVETVQNPRLIGLSPMLILWAIQGALAWLCIFFITTHSARGPFAVLVNMLAFNGIAGYRMIGYMLLSALSGAVAGIIAFFLYTGVFFAINRFLFRDKSTVYVDFCRRLAFTAVYFSAIALIGTVISLISSTTLAILLVCGAMMFVILTYEALKAQWSWQRPDKVIYGVMLGFLLIAFISGYVLRLS